MISSFLLVSHSGVISYDCMAGLNLRSCLSGVFPPIEWIWDWFLPLNSVMHKAGLFILCSYVCFSNVL